ncbi:hypothetical protein VIGAN_10099400, partial [Vigna angularis var. angularis]
FLIFEKTLASHFPDTIFASHFSRAHTQHNCSSSSFFIGWTHTPGSTHTPHHHCFHYFHRFVFFHYFQGTQTT